MEVVIWIGPGSSTVSQIFDLQSVAISRSATGPAAHHNPPPPKRDSDCRGTTSIQREDGFSQLALAARAARKAPGAAGVRYRFGDCGQLGIPLTHPTTRSCGGAAHGAQPVLPGEAVGE
jgi:hypothetical protein